MGLYSFMVGFQVTDTNSIPEGMTYKVIPATKYCVVTAKGKMPDKIGEAWDIYGMQVFKEPIQATSNSMIKDMIVAKILK